MKVTEIPAEQREWPMAQPMPPAPMIVIASMQDLASFETVVQ
jgi:hypothetical protein